ncbi:MAG: winged helix-turn-helix transcriptional regulator [Anaerolineaceae bacterium]|nr:winged helix-turn-helix transcriptional regulator [Anaerolineaceae bacterium]
MTADSKSEEYRDLALLQEIEADPDVSQAMLAEELGVAIGTINWHIKRLVEKGFVKVKRARRRKLRYIITPEGIALRARLTVDYIQQSFKLFRHVRERVTTLLQKLEAMDIHTVRLDATGDVADVCRLTCMEQHFTLTENPEEPALVVDGLKVRLELNSLESNHEEE